MDTTPNLSLPYIMAAQAQKHVTHNEAIRALDALVQISVLDRDLSTPPGAPEEGGRYIVATGASGAWSGHDGHVAAWQDGTWMLYAPAAGWLAWVADEQQLAAFDGTDWIDAAPPADMQLLAKVGINTDADAINRLALAADASLFTHAGAGHQQKINKATAGDTGSQLLQTAFSGRAEHGLIGDDNWRIKVSPDGATWYNAVLVDRSTGRVGIGADVVPEFPLEVIGTQATAAVTRASNDNASAHLVLRKARGTPASPSAVQADDVLGNVAIRGHDGSQYTLSSRTSIRGYAAESWTTDAQGTYLTFWTTPIGSTTEREVARVTPDGVLRISQNVSPPPAPVAGSVVHVVGVDGTNGRIMFDGFGGAGTMTFRRSRGTAAAPSALAANDQMGSFQAYGYGATAYSSASRATFNFVAAENWTDSAQGTYARIQLTPNGGTSQGEVFRWLANGDVRIGTDGVAACKLDVDGPVRVKSYTVAGLPSAAAGAGQLIYVSNETGGAVIAFSDGSNWRRVTDRAVVS